MYVLQLKRAVHSRGNDNAANKMKTIYELSVPTCSYRMGVPDMGYGMMTLSKHVRFQHDLFVLLLIILTTLVFV